MCPAYDLKADFRQGPMAHRNKSKEEVTACGLCRSIEEGSENTKQA
jgi:hypothetical protein